MVRGEKFLSGGFLLRQFSISSFCTKKDPGMSSCRILFFSDTHIREEWSRSYFPFLKWKNSSLIRENLIRAVEETHPDVIVFGGDLAGTSACFPEGVSLFSALDVKRKFAIYGNWDKKTNTFFSYHAKKRLLENAGVQLLVNEGVFLREDLYLGGMDDFRMGYPLFAFPDMAKKEDVTRIIACHSPDTVPGRIREEDLRENDIFLCGHTHGGQIRLPFFGAFHTSTYSGKKLEKNWYIHKKTHARMFVSSGIGTTFIKVRLFAPPEIVLLEFL